VDVAASTEQDRLVSHEVDISEKAISELVSTLKRSLGGITTGNFPAKPDTISCAACDVRRLCSERCVNDAG